MVMGHVVPHQDISWSGAKEGHMWRGQSACMRSEENDVQHANDDD